MILFIVRVEVDDAGSLAAFEILTGPMTIIATGRGQAALVLLFALEVPLLCIGGVGGWACSAAQSRSAIEVIKGVGRLTIMTTLTPTRSTIS